MEPEQAHAHLSWSADESRCCPCSSPSRQKIGLLARLCPFCRRYHTHSPEPGHRVAHCHRTGVFPDGYGLVECQQGRQGQAVAPPVMPEGVSAQKNPVPPRVSAQVARFDSAVAPSLDVFDAHEFSA